MTHIWNRKLRLVATDSLMILKGRKKVGFFVYAQSAMMVISGQMILKAGQDQAKWQEQKQTGNILTFLHCRVHMTIQKELKPDWT